MKKILKITVLALTISAVMLGCKNNVDVEPPILRNLSVRDAKVPDGYTFKGTKTATNYEECLNLMETLANEGNLWLEDPWIAFLVSMNSIKNDTDNQKIMEKAQADLDAKNKADYEFTPKIYKLFTDTQTISNEIDLKKSTITQTKSPNSGKIDAYYYYNGSVINPTASTPGQILSNYSTCNLKLDLKDKEQKITTNLNEIIVFDINQSFKGILVTKFTQQLIGKLTVTTFTAIDFYKPDGTPSYSFTKEDIENFNNRKKQDVNFG